MIQWASLVDTLPNARVKTIVNTRVNALVHIRVSTVANTIVTARVKRHSAYASEYACEQASE